MQLAKRVWNLAKETATKFGDDKASRLGAAIAYYSIFSLGPLLIIVIAVAGLVFGPDAVRGELFGQLKGMVGDQGASAIQTMVSHAYQPKAGIISAAIGVATLILGAAGVITQLKDSLNTIWRVEPKPGAGIRYFIKTYIVSLAAIIGIGFLLTISLVISAAIAAFGAWATSWLPLPEAALHAISFVVSLLLMGVLFAAMFKFLPDVHVPWTSVWPGALLTTILFTIGKTLIGLYLGKASIGSTYGAAGSIVVLLIWIYYSSQIFLAGAEFTEVYMRMKGEKTQPTRDARFIGQFPTAQLRPS